MKTYHLVPNGNSWKLKFEGGKVLANYESKLEGITDSIRFVERETGSLKIHRADGTIEEERTYPRSADPAERPG
jgi:hypothetical protein